MAATKKPAAKKKLSIKDLAGKEVEKQALKKVRGGVRPPDCFSLSASKRPK